MRLTTACLLAWSLLTGGFALAQNPGVDPLDTTPRPVTIPAPVAPPNLPGSDPVTIQNPNAAPLATPDVTAVRQVNQGDTPMPTQFRVYVGTYTNERSHSEGIYQFTLDAAKGTLSNQTLVAKSANPSFLAIHPSRKFLYAVNEVGQFGGKPSGSVSAYAIDPKSGALSLLNSESSGGADPCFVTVDATGSAVLVANYSGGSVSVLPVGSDGKLGPATETIQHQGSGATKRQTSPHAHSVNLDAANKIAVVADLGLDKLMVYRFDPQTATIRPNTPAFATLPPGAGPRHLAFHPDGRHAYVINELNNTITVLDYDQARGSFATLQTISTRPEGAKTTSYTAEVVVHPSGRFVYGSNRGDDTLAIFTVAAASGKLTPVGYQPTGGKNPRNFAIDPTGQFLLAGSQDSNTITLFRIAPDTGRLTPVGEPIPCPAPVCIRFIPLGG